MLKTKHCGDSVMVFASFGLTQFTVLDRTMNSALKQKVLRRISGHQFVT